jgi:hypothetical protein
MKKTLSERVEGGLNAGLKEMCESETRSLGECIAAARKNYTNFLVGLR